MSASDQATKYALKLLAISRTSAQISGIVKPADWSIACLIESIDSGTLNLKQGETMETLEKQTIAAVRRIFRAHRNQPKSEEPNWLLNELFKRVTR
jgi:hypothetical protein